MRCLVALIGTVLLHALPLAADAAGVRARFDLDDRRGAPFPSDRYTVIDDSQNTGLRVALPKPDCVSRPSDCQDIDVINTLDGFNLQPRLSIPFDGPIEPGSVTSETVFLLSLGSALPGGDRGGRKIGINRMVWDVATTTLHVESDEFLDQHTRYALIVTRGVRDPLGDPVEASTAFRRFRHDVNFGQTGDPQLKRYRKALLDALAAARAAGVHEEDIVAASVFTTLSATAILERIRDQIRAADLLPADFLLGPGATRTTFPLSSLTAFAFTRQWTTAPNFTPDFGLPLPLPFLGLVPETVGHLAFGKYISPDYRATDGAIPALGTRSGQPPVQTMSEVYFNLVVPSGPKPPAGWPVVIFGHGRTHNKQFPTLLVVSKMAARGIATIAINAFGSGGGPLSTLTLTRVGGEQITFSAGGRAVDQNGDGIIGVPEGNIATGPRGIIRDRDGKVQAVVDLMQLVRVIEIGLDFDGDGVADFDPARISYLGQSRGGHYGTIFLAVEPGVRVGVLNATGGSDAETFHLNPTRRPDFGSLLAARTPSLINLSGTSFNENLPLRDEPPVVNTVAGAMEIQEVIDNMEWIGQSGNQVAYAPHLRRSSLTGVDPKSVLIQFAKGDQQVPNPNTSAWLRAGDLADRATYFRNDLFLAANQGFKDPHSFLFQQPPGVLPAVTAVALAAQEQVALFLASGGAVIIDPDGPGPIFETPIIPPLPEDLAYIP